MRKILCPPLALALCILPLVSGCAREPQESADSADVAAPSYSAPEVVESTVGKTGERLSLCTGASEEGVYKIETLQMGFCNIMYIDLSTQQEIYLCSVPNCTHDGEFCTSYISLEEDVEPMILAAGDSILLVRNGQSGVSAAGIWIAEKDGANRRNLFTVEDGESIGPGFYQDSTGEFVYFALRGVNRTGGSADPKKELCRLNLSSGELEHLVDYTDYGLYDVDRDCFIVSGGGSRQGFYYMHPGFGEAAYIEDTPFYTSPEGDVGAYVSNNFAFEYTFESALLRVRNLADGSVQEIDCSPYAVQPDEEHRPDLSGPYGDFGLYVTYSRSEEGYFLPAYHLIDLTTGTFSEEFTLKDSMGHGIMPQENLGDQFLVVYDYQYITVDYGENGQKEDVIVPCYGLISKEDYFNSVPNYTPIKREG